MIYYYYNESFVSSQYRRPQKVVAVFTMSDKKINTNFSQKIGPKKMNIKSYI